MSITKEKIQNSPSATEQVNSAGVIMAGIRMKAAYLPGSLLDKALVGDAEGAAQGLGRVVGEHLLAHQVHVQVNGGIDGSIHPAVAIKHCKVSLFFLVLSMEAQSQGRELGVAGPR